MNAPNFYCRKYTLADFDILEWNEAFKFCIEQGLSEEEMNRILEGDPCKQQCFDCCADVGDRQKETREFCFACKGRKIVPVDENFYVKGSEGYHKTKPCPSCANNLITI